MSGNEPGRPEAGGQRRDQDSHGNGRTLHIDRYYDSLPGLLRRFDRVSRQAAFHGVSAEETVAPQTATQETATQTMAQEWMDWRDDLRTRLRSLLGLDLMESCPLDPKLVERSRVRAADDAGEYGDITRDKILIQVEPDVWMPCYVLVPDRPRTGDTGKALCWICPHGHQGGGKYSVAGVRGIPAIDDAIRRFNYDYGLQLALRGYVALCPDARGFGERRDRKLQRDDERSFLRGTCAQLAHMAEPLGLTVAGMLTWDLMRLVDYVAGRGEWDMASLGCFGFSGGGMQTLWLAALDDRVRRAFISGYMYGVRDSLLTMNGNCSCNYVPGLWSLVDMGDVGSLIAPRPLIVQSCIEDHLNGVRGIVNADEQVAIIRNAYHVLGEDAQLIHLHAEGGHHFEPAGVWDAIAESDPASASPRITHPTI
ncbi:alpha/beta hydrolase family protein [Bifidobacterium tissieri]|nr:alpha/beta hydrolase family protein [Bifidobacterium tissieri]